MLYVWWLSKEVTHHRTPLGKQRRPTKRHRMVLKCFPGQLQDIPIRRLYATMKTVMLESFCFRKNLCQCDLNRFLEFSLLTCLNSYICNF